MNFFKNFHLPALFMILSINVQVKKRRKMTSNIAPSSFQCNIIRELDQHTPPLNLSELPSFLTPCSIGMWLRCFLETTFGKYRG